MLNIHPTAIIETGASIGQDVEIGPYCVIGPNVSIGDNCVLKSHVVIDGDTSIGASCTIHQFACLGTIGNILKPKDVAGRLVIGERNEIREYVSIQAGHLSDDKLTLIGNDNFIMVHSHIGHDCRVGDHNVIAVGVKLAGHVIVGNYTNLGGLAAVHQFCSIGSYAFVGGGSIVVGNVIPFGMVKGNHAVLEGLNLIGMKRRGFSKDDIHATRHLFRDLFKSRNDKVFNDQLKAARIKFASTEATRMILDFIETANSRGFCRAGTL